MKIMFWNWNWLFPMKVDYSYWDHENKMSTVITLGNRIAFLFMDKIALPCYNFTNVVEFPTPIAFSEGWSMACQFTV